MYKVNNDMDVSKYMKGFKRNKMFLPAGFELITFNPLKQYINLHFELILGDESPISIAGVEQSIVMLVFSLTTNCLGLVVYILQNLFMMKLYHLR